MRDSIRGSQEDREEIVLKMGNETGSSARSVLWYLVFVGFAVNYMIRINSNITIVTMVRSGGAKKAQVEEGPELSSAMTLKQNQPRMYACYVERNESDVSTGASSTGGNRPAGRMRSEPNWVSPEKWLLNALQVHRIF